MADNGKIALVIGNGAYAYASTLANPANDARDIAATLARIGFRGIAFDDASSRKIANKEIAPLLDLDYAGLRRALAAFARAAEDADQAVLYYAGHGIEVSGQNYLIPVDARLEHVKDVEFETSSMMQVLNAVGGEAASGLRLIILDACRDNPFRSRLFATRDASRGLRAVEPGRNILVAYAAKHGTVALDGDGGNSPYARALIQHLEEPGLEIVDLFREVKDAVLESTGHRQEPYLYGSLGRRREYFVTPPAAAPQRVAKLPEFEAGTVEHTYWIDVKDTADPEDLEQFIKRFPDGKFELLARRNIDRLISACSDKALLLRLVARHPDSPSLALAHDRIASIEAEEQADAANTKQPDPGTQDQELEQGAPEQPPSFEVEETKEQRKAQFLKQSTELSRLSRMIADLLLMFYSPSYKWVLAIGVCSAVLSALTFPTSTSMLDFDQDWMRIPGAAILVGPIFALALVVSLWLSGARNFWKLLIFTVGAILIFLVAGLAVIFAGELAHSLVGVGVSPLFGGATGGFVGAIAMSALVQFAVERKIDARVLITTAILGAIAGSLLIVDAKSAPSPLKATPWFCLAAWQVMMLMTSASIVSRRMRGAEWRSADWPPARW